jgi:hypothetical protein
MVADEDQARAWFEKAAGSGASGPRLEGWHEGIVTRRGATVYVAIHRVKRICGQ